MPVRTQNRKPTSLQTAGSPPPATLLAWFDRAHRDLPWRRTSDPYGVWISEIMLQQTQVKTVVPYWERWMKTLPTIRSLAEADEDRVLKLWEGLGYYSRARNLQRAAREIVGRFNGVFPTAPDDILSLPGIGRYTAGAVASIAFDQPEPILDGNVIRVLTRLFTLGGDPKSKPLNEQLWTIATDMIRDAASLKTGGPRRCARFNQALMELGATLCTPTSPKCSECPWSRDCAARREGSQLRYPETAPRAAVTARFFATAVITHRGGYLVRRRTEGSVNAGFWEFPSDEIARETDAAKHLSQWLGLDDPDWTPLPDLRHAITRYRITQRVFTAKAAPALRGLPGEWRWATTAELHELHLTGPHRKLADRLLSK